ncbi:MAG: HAD family hydrolase [Clostridia bacterium]|nr:HAD family hydrolase [Clostridia bacterium]
MRYQAILFDLDGTLLPMELEPFAKIYFGALAKVLAPFGLTPETMFKPFWAATKAMMVNTTGKLNSDVFWETFSALTGVQREAVEPICDAFYNEGFQTARAATRENPLAREAIRIAREKADKVVLATNPLFPMAGQKTRLSWLGLAPEDFDLVTCYTSDRHCKPNPAYFHDICQRLDLDPAKCLMIGNDDREDMHCAIAAGMDAYLVTDCRLPDPENPWQGAQGTFAEMVELLKSL